MTLATQVKRITDSKPFYALTGAGDLAVERAREYAGTVARDFPEKAREYADAAASRLNQIYDDLAVRGRRIVSKVTGRTAMELEDVSERAEPAASENGARRSSSGTRAKATSSSQS